MKANRVTARQRALAHNLLLDPDVIRERVIGGDAAFGQRILLTALIKGDEATRVNILDEIRPQYFLPVFGLLFRWVSQELIAKGRVEEDTLYEKMEEHVRDSLAAPSTSGFAESHFTVEEILPGYLAPIDHVLAIEVPDQEMIDKAISALHRHHNWRLAQKKEE